MFDETEIRRVIRLQEKSYRLLRWFTSALGKGTIRFQNAHATMGGPQVARDWIEHFLKSLPPDTRPEPEELEDLANIFSSYLTSSFDLEENPGTRRQSGWCCEMCSYLVQASNLKTKHVTSGNKQKAMGLKVAFLRRRASETGREIDDAAAERLVKELADDIALVTYISQLLARMHGTPGTPASLALWREFAWSKAGSPDKKFKLDAEKILGAEKRVMASLAG